MENQGWNVRYGHMLMARQMRLFSQGDRVKISPDAIALKIRKAKTDTEPLPDNLKALEARPEADNLITLYAALADTTKAKVLSDFSGQQFSGFKKTLTDIAVAKLAPITARMREMQTDHAAIDKILRHGAERASALAEKHMREVKDIVGLWR